MPAQKGEVIEYDAARAMAKIRLTSGDEVEMHAVCYYSGRPSRLPAVGDKVLAQVRPILGVNTVVFARPAVPGEQAVVSPDCIVSEKTLAEATFQLLASSTAQRYARQAVEFSRKLKLHRRKEEELVERLQALWVVLMQPGRDTRPVEEIEAALILVALWDRQLELPQEFQTIAHWDAVKSEAYPGTGWLWALTRKLQEDF
jgi:hypothetical protein